MVTLNKIAVKKMLQWFSQMQCCSIEDASWVIYRSAEWFKIEPGEEGNCFSISSLASNSQGNQCLQR